MSKKQPTIRSADHYAGAIHEAVHRALKIVASDWHVEHVGFDERGVALHLYTREGIKLVVDQDVEF